MYSASTTLAPSVIAANQITWAYDDVDLNFFKSTETNNYNN